MIYWYEEFVKPCHYITLKGASPDTMYLFWRIRGLIHGI
jgi:hypothetical protein